MSHLQTPIDSNCYSKGCSLAYGEEWAPFLETPKQGSDEILTIEELSEYLKISKSSLYKLVQEGSLPGTKIGRHWRFQREVIDNWMKSNQNDLNRSSK